MPTEPRRTGPGDRVRTRSFRHAETRTRTTGATAEPVSGEEAPHRRARPRTPWIAVGAVAQATGPGVAQPVDAPVLHPLPATGGVPAGDGEAPAVGATSFDGP